MPPFSLEGDERFHYLLKVQQSCHWHLMVAMLGNFKEHTKLKGLKFVCA